MCYRLYKNKKLVSNIVVFNFTSKQTSYNLERQCLSPGRRPIVAPTFRRKQSDIWGDNLVARATTSRLPKVQNAWLEIEKTSNLKFGETRCCLLCDKLVSPNIRLLGSKLKKPSNLKFGETRCCLPCDKFVSLNFRMLGSKLQNQAI